MKLLDDKGRLFGKVNALDVLFLLIGLLVIIVAANFLFFRGASVTIPIEVVMKTQTVDLLDNVVPGKSITSNGKTIGIIDDLDIYKDKDDSQGLFDMRTVILTLNITVQKKNNKIIFAGKELSIQSMVAFDIEDKHFTGTIFTFNNTKQMSILNLTIETDQLISSPDELYVGRIFRDYLGKPIAEIKDVDSYNVDDSFRRVQIILEVQTRNIGNNQYFRRQLLVEGFPLTTQDDAFGFTGKLVNIGDNNLELSQKTVKVRIPEVRGWVSKKIKVGDIEMTSKGRVLASIVAKEVVPSLMVITSDVGNVYLKDNPLLNDIYLTITLTGEREGDNFFYKGKRIVDNAPFFMDLGTTQIQGTIIGIQ